VRVVDELHLQASGFQGTQPAATGRPWYHPAVPLKIYIYGYLNQVQSSRRLEREAQRNVELMWLTGRLAPDFKTIAEFRKDHGAAIHKVCREYVESYTMLTLNADQHSLMRRMHKPDPKLGPDRQDKRSLVLLEPQDFDQWLAGTVEHASALIRLTPVERFDAGPMSPVEPATIGLITNFQDQA